jgi:hypothetical protein
MFPIEKLTNIGIPVLDIWDFVRNQSFRAFNEYLPREKWTFIELSAGDTVWIPAGYAWWQVCRSTPADDTNHVGLSIPYVSPPLMQQLKASVLYSILTSGARATNEALGSIKKDHPDKSTLRTFLGVIDIIDSWLREKTDPDLLARFEEVFGKPSRALLKEPSNPHEPPITPKKGKSAERVSPAPLTNHPHAIPNQPELPKPPTNKREPPAPGEDSAPSESSKRAKHDESIPADLVEKGGEKKAEEQEEAEKEGEEENKVVEKEKEDEGEEEEQAADEGLEDPADPPSPANPDDESPPSRQPSGNWEAKE